jgi:hypothetical protein
MSEYFINVKNKRFEPTSLKIKPGDTIKWTVVDEKERFKSSLYYNTIRRCVVGTNCNSFSLDF